MDLNKLSAQISVFLQDGIMNPSKYKKEIDNVFENIFDVDVFSINAGDAPDDMPLVRCDSSDGSISFDFARKRINFYMNFLSKKSKLSFEKYKEKILEFITLKLKSVTDISRIGIAFSYYIGDIDNNNDYWIKKYNFPLTTDKTTELAYTINNVIEYDDIKYNNIINLSNALVNDKIHPIVSVDFNNMPVTSLTEGQLEFILITSKVFEMDSVKEVLK